jgi:hypothetical protein
VEKGGWEFVSCDVEDGLPFSVLSVIGEEEVDGAWVEVLLLAAVLMFSVFVVFHL